MGAAGHGVQQLTWGVTAHLGCRAVSQESPASGTALCITLFSDFLSSFLLERGLSDLKGPFQPNDSMIQCFLERPPAQR